MKKITLTQAIAAGLDSAFHKKKTTFGDKEVSTGDLAYKKFSEKVVEPSFSMLTIDHYHARLLYEYLRHNGRDDKDFSKKVYFPDDIRVNEMFGSITKSSIGHLAMQLLKDIKDVKMINFECLKKEERLLIKRLNENTEVVVLGDNICTETKLMAQLEKKRVLVLSSHSQLFKLQHMHQEEFYPELSNLSGKFAVEAIDIEECFKSAEAYTLFEKLDALKVEILKYECDVVLINLSSLAGPITSFVSSLNIKSINLEEKTYKVFGIAKDAGEKMKHNSFWVDLNAYCETSGEKNMSTIVIGAPIKIKKGRRK